MSANGWQPIETAPKDGRGILTWDPTASPFFIRLDCWDDSWTPSGWTGNPTLWHRLPKHPKPVKP